MDRDKPVRWPNEPGLLQARCRLRRSYQIMSRYLVLLPCVLLACRCNDVPTIVGSDDAGTTFPGDDGGTTCFDNDGDRYGSGCPLGDDCDDNNKAVRPGAKEFCDDGIDNDCDGNIDPVGCLCVFGITRECYAAAPSTAGVGPCRKGIERCELTGHWGSCLGQVLPIAELCNGVDDNCDGQIDEGLLNACRTCGTPPAEVCQDGFDNNCNGTVDDGCGTCDPGCLCSGGSCVCHPKTNQPCYGGPPGTAGVGPCREGLHDCVAAGGGVYEWGTCRGQVLPAAEVCGDGIDSDCDGLVDEGCTPGCTPVAEQCDGRDNDCDGAVDEGVTNACGGCGAVEPERCGDGLDNNCDGRVDEDCRCVVASQPCYRGPIGTLGLGECRAGVQLCTGGELQVWGECIGDGLPSPEVCGDGLDNDCNGPADDGCVCQPGATRPCGSSVGTCKLGTQTCAGASWGACQGGTGPVSEVCDGKDNDCDGLTDEGVLNACGKCPPEPCYVQTYDSAADLGLGAFDGVSQSPSNPLDPNCVPGSLCLDSTRTSLPFIWIANTGDNAVVKLDTVTGQRFGPYPSWGESPSRTAVVPTDGSVWVGNRGFNNPANVALSNLVHLKADGSLICRADLPGIIRAVAIDADGNVWAGSFNDRKMYKVSGTVVDSGQTPPRCQVLGSVTVSACPYGAAVDSQNHVWVAGNCNWASSFNSADQALIEINAATTAVLSTRVPPSTLGCFSNYGIAVDAARHVWLGAYGCQAVIRHDSVNNTWVKIDIAEGTPRGIAVSPDNYVYTALSHGTPGDSGANTRVAKISRANNTYSIINLGSQGVHPIGVAVDQAQKIWTVAYSSGTAARIEPATGVPTFFSVGNAPYTYSDMTGMQNLLYTRPTGTWTIDYDSGYAQARWSQVTWVAIQPAGTQVSVRVRSASTQAGLSSAAWLGYFTASPADISAVPANRWLQVQVKLDTVDPNKTPVVQEVRVLWAY